MQLLHHSTSSIYSIYVSQILDTTKMLEKLYIIFRPVI